MKIKVNSRGLQRVLGSVSKAVVPKPLISAYEYYLARAKDGILTLLASDGNLFISDKCECEGEGEALLPAKTFGDLVNALPDTDIAVDAVSDSATINWGKGKSSIPCLSDTTEYPAISNDDEEARFKIGVPELVSAITHVVDFTATDEFRLMLTGVYFDIQPFGIKIVATDGNIVSASPISTGAECASFIMPAVVAKAARGLRGADAEIILGKKTVRVVTDTATVGGKLIEARFPPYQRVYPASSDKVLELSRDSFLASLKRVMVCGNKELKTLRLTLNDEHPYMFSEDIRFSTKAGEDISDYTYSGGPITIGFNADLLRKAVSALASERVRISLTEPSKPALIESEEDLTRTVLMPIILK